MIHSLWESNGYYQLKNKIDISLLIAINVNISSFGSSKNWYVVLEVAISATYSSKYYIILFLAMPFKKKLILFYLTS
jgi:hypothetical protein